MTLGLIDLSTSMRLIMTPTDHKVVFTALGFLAVILSDDVPKNKQALRARSIATLIESFCHSSLPELQENTRGKAS
jgi:hypothetical protein